VDSHAGIFGLLRFESGFAADGLILAEEFRCALRIWPAATTRSARSTSDQRKGFSRQKLLLTSDRECSGIPLDELAYAHRRLACQ
jgi:hypothetical protein